MLGSRRVRQFSSQARSRVASGLTLLLLLGLAYLLYRNPPPLPQIHLDVSVQRLPRYAFDSFARMLAAYLLALIFAIAYGSAAAANRTAEAVLIPVLDLLQSVPVLAFFPAAVFFFVNLFHGSRLGVEIASVFLIFTAMAWNMAFAVFESLSTIPKEMEEAADSFGLKGWLKFRKALFPACVPKLVYASMISWAGGWYFLMACEMIAIGPVRYRLPGLGSYLYQSTERGEIRGTFAGLFFLIFIIVLLDLFVWRPLAQVAEKYRYEFTTPEAGGEQFLLRLFRRVWSALATFLRARFEGLRFPRWGRLPRPRASGGSLPLLRMVGWMAAVSGVGLLLYGLVAAAAAIVHLLAEAPLAAARQIPLATAASFLRLSGAYLLSLAWTVPAALFIGESKRVFAFVTPLAQIAASIPATALFPLILFVAVHFVGGMNLASILLILTGMQWYLFFSLIGGMKNIPEDLKEAARSFGLSRRERWIKLYLPAVTPSLVTGSITAWGGGWNALIVAEYVVYKQQTYSVTGIGALLDDATYRTGDLSMILLSLMMMMAVILTFNRLVWRRFYAFAVERYKFDY